MVEKKILRIANQPENISNGQIAIGNTVDAEIGIKLLNWRDHDGNARRALAKGQPGLLSTLTLNAATTTGTTGLLKHDTNGTVTGGKITVAEFNALLSDGPISGGLVVQDVAVDTVAVSGILYNVTANTPVTITVPDPTGTSFIGGVVKSGGAEDVTVTTVSGTALIAGATSQVVERQYEGVLYLENTTNYVLSGDTRDIPPESISFVETETQLHTAIAKSKSLIVVTTPITISTTFVPTASDTSDIKIFGYEITLTAGISWTPTTGSFYFANDNIIVPATANLIVSSATSFSARRVTGSGTITGTATVEELDTNLTAILTTEDFWDNTNSLTILQIKNVSTDQTAINNSIYNVTTTTTPVTITYPDPVLTKFYGVVIKASSIETAPVNITTVSGTASVGDSTTQIIYGEAEGITVYENTTAYVITQDSRGRVQNKLARSTGIMKGIDVTQASSTTVNISTGTYTIEDPTDLSDPDSKLLQYAGITGLTITNLSSKGYTVLKLNANGDVTQTLNGEVTGEDWRLNPFIGYAQHISGTCPSTKSRV
jgi:hypothetical protein